MLVLGTCTVEKVPWMLDVLHCVPVPVFLLRMSDVIMHNPNPTKIRT